MWRTGRAGVETPTSPLDGGAVAAAPGQLGGPHPGPRAGGRAGSSSSAVAHRGAPTTPLAPGRAVGAVAVGAQPGTAPARSRAALSGRSRGGRSETGGSRRGDAPPPLHPGARPDRGARWWTSSECYRGPGSGRSWRASRLNADADKPRRLRRTRRERGPAQRGRGQAGGRRCMRGRRHTRPVRPVRLGAGTGGPVAERSGDSKRWPARIFHPPRPALLPSRNGAMTPFPGRAGAAAHPKDTRRPPFSAPPTPRAATAGPPEASAAPGPSSTPARTATAGAASRSPRGNHRTAPGPARISRIRADAESAAPAGGVAGASWPASASRRSAALARGRRDPIPVPAPSRSAPVGPRERHITRENVCPGYVLAGCPAISRVKRRSRGGRGVRCGSRGAPPRRRERGARRGPSRPTSSVRPARTSAPTGRGPARARRRDSGDQVAGLGAPRTRTGTATGPGPDSAPDPRHHGRTGEPPAADSGPARTWLAGPEARLGRGWFA